MNDRDNADRILRFDRPERVMTHLPLYRLAYFGCNHEGFEHPRGHDVPVGTRWSDIWGTVWHKEQEGVMGFPRGSPLDTPDKLRTYAWPDPDDERLCGQVYPLARRFDGGEKFLAGAHRDTLWEKAYMLVGMERLMECFFTEPTFVREVLRRIVDFQLGMARHYLDAGVEFACLGDDLGTQTGPLLGLRIVEEFLLPEYRRLFDLYKARGVRIDFHCCGNVAGVLSIFRELGVDVLNPVQATANDLDLVRRETHGRMALCGAVSTATIMAGPVERIRREVRRRLWQLGRDGGYFCAPDQGMPFPEAHLAAFREAVEQYGRYPLQPPDSSA